MNDSLAREILAKITGWTAERLTCERKDLQLLSDYKYDEYQQFTPGMRFTESLALWLGQFDGTQKRDIAYNFIKRQHYFYLNVRIKPFDPYGIPRFHQILSDQADCAETQR